MIGVGLLLGELAARLRRGPSVPAGYTLLSGKQADGSYVTLRGKQADGSYLNILGKVG